MKLNDEMALDRPSPAQLRYIVAKVKQAYPTQIPPKQADSWGYGRIVGHLDVTQYLEDMLNGLD